MKAKMRVKAYILVISEDADTWLYVGLHVDTGK